MESRDDIGFRGRYIYCNTTLGDNGMIRIGIEVL